MTSYGFAVANQQGIRAALSEREQLWRQAFAALAEDARDEGKSRAWVLAAMADALTRVGVR